MAQHSSLLTSFLERREDTALLRILPFALFMAFIAFNSVVEWLAPATWQGTLSLWLYPVRLVCVVAALLYAWPAYSELKSRPRAQTGDVIVAVVVGIVVYLAWVRMDWSWATQGEMTGYNPWQVGAGWGIALAIVRLFGAAIVVPIMEELFWRSWLIRYLISPAFTAVRLGSFTVMSCAVTVVFFGLEHQLWLAGMMAGLAYNLVLYKTRRLWACILSHAVTNLILGIHVLVTGEWQWW